MDSVSDSDEFNCKLFEESRILCTNWKKWYCDPGNERYDEDKCDYMHICCDGNPTDPAMHPTERPTTDDDFVNVNALMDKMNIDTENTTEIRIEFADFTLIHIVLLLGVILTVVLIVFHVCYKKEG
eukprot:247957_1